MQSADFFKDLTVVELASVLAGPATALFFAELGAKVIKIENKKTGGDVTRTWKNPNELAATETSAYFYAVNFLKEHLFLDLENQTDHAHCLQLLRKADIVIVNFKPGDAEKFGLSFEHLHPLFPQLIYASVCGFSPDSDRVAYDLILQAESGLMSINGDEQSGPIKLPIAFIDLLSAHQLKEGILLALLHRYKTNVGLKVNVSLMDTAIASLANQGSNWLESNYLSPRMGSLHPNIAPYGEVFQTSNHQAITFAIGSDKQFQKLCAFVLPQLPIPEEFSHNALRVKHRNSLAQWLQKGISTFTFEELQQFCLSAHIPYAKIRTIAEALSLPEIQHLLLPRENGKKNIRTVSFSLHEYQHVPNS